MTGAIVIDQRSDTLTRPSAAMRAAIAAAPVGDDQHGDDAYKVVARARERGVLINAFGARTIGVVTHLDVSREQCARAAEILVDVID